MGLWWRFVFLGLCFLFSCHITALWWHIYWPCRSILVVMSQDYNDTYIRCLVPLILSCHWSMMTLCIGCLFPLVLSCHCFMMTLCIGCLFLFWLSCHWFMMTPWVGCLIPLRLSCHWSLITLCIGGLFPRMLSYHCFMMTLYWLFISSPAVMSLI